MSAVVTDVIRNRPERFARYRALILQGLAHGHLCGGIEQELDHVVHANAYLTPGNTSGFTPHYDTHEVLVLQLAGTKHWRIYEPPVVLPHRRQPFNPVGYSLPSKPLLEVDLEPGLWTNCGIRPPATASLKCSWLASARARSPSGARFERMSSSLRPIRRSSVQRLPTSASGGRGLKPPWSFSSVVCCCRVKRCRRSNICARKGLSGLWFCPGP